MRRQITGLHAADRCAADQVPDGIFLVRVQRVYFRRQAQKPYYTLTLAILEPSRFSGHTLSSRIYCNPKALWKLNWFLRDFGYDTELLGRDEVDETQLVGLKGVVKTSHIVFNGASLLRFDGFASGRSLGRTFAGKSGQPAGGLNDLQLHPDQPIPNLPAAVSASLPRWLEGERHPGSDAVRPRLRTSPGRLFSPGRSRSSPVLRMVCTVRTRACTTRTETPGIACCGRESCC